MTTQTTTIQKSRATKFSMSKLIWVSLLAMVTAGVVNLGLYFAIGSLFPEVTAWPGAGIGQIMGATNGYLFFGAIVFALVARYSSSPARHYTIIATLGLLLSLGMPIAAGFGYAAPGAPPADLATVITLSLMHVVSYAISVPLFIRRVLG